MLPVRLLQAVCNTTHIHNTHTHNNTHTEGSGVTSDLFPQRCQRGLDPQPQAVDGSRLCPHRGRTGGLFSPSAVASASSRREDRGTNGTSLLGVSRSGFCSLRSRHSPSFPSCSHPFIPQSQSHWAGPEPRMAERNKGPPSLQPPALGGEVGRQGTLVDGSAGLEQRFVPGSRGEGD